MNELARKNFVPTEQIVAQIITDLFVIFLQSADTGSPLVTQTCNIVRETLRSLESMAKLNANTEFEEWKIANKKRVRSMENYYSIDTLKVLLQDTPIKINDRIFSIEEVCKILRTSKYETFLRFVRDFKSE